MSVQQEQQNAMGRTTASPGGGVQPQAGRAAREVATELSDRSREVATETREQAQRVMREAGDEARRQLDDRSAQAASRLRAMSDQLGALSEGRTEEAAPLMRYVDDARSMVSQLATRLEQGGAQGIADDMRRFARRRPGLFLVGAGVTGFAVGRLLRAGSAVAREEHEQQPASMSAGRATMGELPPRQMTVGTEPVLGSEL